MAERIIKKSLAGRQDILFGNGQVSQVRAGGLYPITKVSMVWACTSHAELLSLDTSQFTQATVDYQGSITLWGWTGSRWYCKETDLTLVGSFEAGFTYTATNQVGCTAAGIYSWDGVLPKTVESGTDPIAVAGYVPRTAVVLRSELATDGGASLIGYQRKLPYGYSGTVQDFINDMPGVNIWEFADLVTVRPTAANPATWDWTPAFVAAINTGRKIVVPEGSYTGGDITPSNGLVLVGAGGESSKTLLKVKAGAVGFFTPNTSSSDYTSVVISGVAVTAEDNTSSFWKQSSNEYYTAYAHFYDVNIYQSVRCGFNGFFIFTEWHKCRSGYNGSGAAHSFISSLPAAYGQARQTNLCQVNMCRLFNSTTNPMVDIAYGARWDFNHTDFEGCTTRAIRARGVYGGKINGGWLERCSGAYVLDIDISSTPNAQGSRPWTLTHAFVNLNSGSGAFANVGNASVLRIDNTVFVEVPTSGVLKAGSGALYVGDGVEVLSGDSSAFWNQSLPTASFFPNGNPLPFGEYGVESAYLTNNGFSSVANGASYLDPVNQTARLTLSGAANAAYYTIPAKVLPLLRGKKVRVKVIGSFVSSAGGDILSIGVWDSVTTPSYSNSTSAHDLVPTVTTDMASATVDVTVGATATSFAIGIMAGGGALGAVFVLESISAQIL